MSDYPRWIYYPRSEKAPNWVGQVVLVFSKQRAKLDTAFVNNKSDVALSILRPDLKRLASGLKVALRSRLSIAQFISVKVAYPTVCTTSTRITQSSESDSK